MGHMSVDRSGMEVLDAAECRALLASGLIGRIVFTDRALPAVQSVNYALVDDHVIIRTTESSRLATAAHGAVVAFEIDDFDPAFRTGWSVVVVGRTERVPPASPDLARLRAPPLWPWAPGDRDHYIRVRCEMVTGSGWTASPGTRSVPRRGAAGSRCGTSPPVGPPPGR
ncbi:pyridoxamine 5'-phosphate oxidase family protein [Actinomadura kijaniata]